MTKWISWGQSSFHIPNLMQKQKKCYPTRTNKYLYIAGQAQEAKLQSKASKKLGYTNVKEFGGIIDWPYEIVK